jgi:hypothetical protein
LQAQDLLRLEGGWKAEGAGTWLDTRLLVLRDDIRNGYQKQAPQLVCFWREADTGLSIGAALWSNVR